MEFWCHSSIDSLPIKYFFVQSISFGFPAKMLKLFVVYCTGIALVYCAPQQSDVEIEDQTFNRINEAEYDYR